MKVLLIESDRLLAGSLTNILKSAGHQVVWRVDLQVALETMDSEKPDVIILDLLLAARTGIEFFYELRSYPEWQSLPVFIWSDLAQTEIESLLVGLKNLGIVSYHHKSTTRLKDLVQSLNLASMPA